MAQLNPCVLSAKEKTLLRLLMMDIKKFFNTFKFSKMINTNWIFGRGAGVNFSPNPTVLAPPPNGNLMNTLEGCASVSDDNGNLLFYTDGKNVYNTQAVAQPVYTGLKGDRSSSQSCIIVPDPANANGYYIFTADGNSQYSVAPNDLFGGVHVDIANPGNWIFTDIGNLPVYANSITGLNNANLSPAEKLTVLRAPNCDEFWILTIHQRGNPNIAIGDGVIRIYKLDVNGVSFHQELDMNAAGDSYQVRDIGYLKPSHDNKYIAIANVGFNNSNSKSIIILPFDNTTGAINLANPIVVGGFRNQVYGLEFSPNNSLLYASTLGSGYIYQVDLSNVSNVPAPLRVSAQGQYAGGHCHGYGALQLGPDNQIYIARPCKPLIGAIKNPDILGLGCDVDHQFLQLNVNPNSNALCQLGLPNLINPACDDGCDCHCGCHGCNENAEEQNEELIQRAKLKYNVVKSHADCTDPFIHDDCTTTAINSGVTLEPCFYFHWGDGQNDQIEEHDTEVFYLTVCNPFKDVVFNGLRITKVTLIPDIHPLEKIHIVPDRFICLDCLLPCSCASREFAMITRANDTAGDYVLQVEYCYDEIVLADGGSDGVVEFPLTITED